MIRITLSLYLIFDDMPHSPMQSRLLWVMWPVYTQKRPIHTQKRPVYTQKRPMHTQQGKDLLRTLSLSHTHTYKPVDTLTHIHTTLSCTHPLSHIHSHTSTLTHTRSDWERVIPHTYEWVIMSQILHRGVSCVTWLLHVWHDSHICCSFHEQWHGHESSCHKYCIGVCHRGSMCTTRGRAMALSLTHIYIHTCTHTHEWAGHSTHVSMSRAQMLHMARDRWVRQRGRVI